MQIARMMGVKPQIKCPRCGGRMKLSQLRTARVKRCAKGCGIWIDQEELDQLAGMHAKRYEVTTDLPPLFVGHRKAL